VTKIALLQLTAVKVERPTVHPVNFKTRGIRLTFQALLCNDHRENKEES